MFGLVSTAVTRHHDHSNFYKGKHLMGWLTVSEVESIIIMVGHGGLWADMVLEVCLTRCGLSIYETSKPASILTYFIQQDHTDSS